MAAGFSGIAPETNSKRECALVTIWRAFRSSLKILLSNLRCDGYLTDKGTY